MKVVFQENPKFGDEHDVAQQILSMDEQIDRLFAEIKRYEVKSSSLWTTSNTTLIVDLHRRGRTNAVSCLIGHGVFFAHTKNLRFKSVDQQRSLSNILTETKVRWTNQCWIWPTCLQFTLFRFTSHEISEFQSTLVDDGLVRSSFISLLLLSGGYTMTSGNVACCKSMHFSIYSRCRSRETSILLSSGLSS